MGFYESVKAVFEQRTAGKSKFTRRDAIVIADVFDSEPMQMVRALEALGLLRPGSLAWFRQNGGITRKQVEEVRAAALDAAENGEAA
jgi:hypothetical protein